MRRQNPLFTPVGAVLTVLLLVGLGMSIRSSGGRAFSPGPLSAKKTAATTLQGFESHAGFENQCSLCHAPLKTTQDKLCLTCHKDVSLQMVSKNGTHSLIMDISSCARCHPDHRGREFDPTVSAFSLFDHSRTIFSLDLHQTDYNAELIDCAACHAVESNFAASNTKCKKCHSDKDKDFSSQHVQEFSQDCLICHDGFDRMTNLDHQTTAFLLDGQHVSVGCVECHKLIDSAQNEQLRLVRASFPAGDADASGDPFTNTPAECAQCHIESEAHSGLFGGACSDCHTTSGWKPATLEERPFEHLGRTGFSLVQHTRNFENQPLVCLECHPTGLMSFDLGTCIACHSGTQERAVFLQGHLELFGEGCLVCHDGIDRMSDFEHARVFPLAGRHSNLDCTSCHQEKIFIGTASECVACHTEPDIHAGFFGLQCQYCHTSQAWTPAQLLIHRFPLDHGGQGEIGCQICHPGSYIGITCYGCHEHQPDLISASHSKAGVAMDLLANCNSCHPDGIINAQE